LYVYALFIAVVAAMCGVLALGFGVYFARSMLRLIYPELLDRPNVLPHRYIAFWDRECLTPGGKEARSRFFVFTFIGIGALVVAGGIAAQIERTEALPETLAAERPEREALPEGCEDCDLPAPPMDLVPADVAPADIN
jgi:hypothetical protein